MYGEELLPGETIVEGEVVSVSGEADGAYASEGADTKAEIAQLEAQLKEKRVALARANGASSEANVDSVSEQIWYIEKHDGSRYVQHNHADGTYECYARGSATHIVDRGRYSMVNGQYSEANFEGSRGSLQSDGASVWIDHHAGVHGYHKYIATSDQYKGGILESSWGAGAATTAQPGHSSPQPGGRRTEGLISTDEIAGCWVCMCFPFGFTAIFSKEATGPDSLKHAGLILPFIPFEEHRIRNPGTNGFYKVGEPQDVDQYSSEDCVCNGLACSMKVC